jgi:transcription antitermination factor NusA-like protein
VNGVYLVDNEGERTATVVVGEDQLSLAIGRDGQNARLAAKLTGWRIDIKSLSEAAGDSLNKLQGDDPCGHAPCGCGTNSARSRKFSPRRREPPDHA